MTKYLPNYLLYNFDEIGFQPGKGGNQRDISAGDRRPCLHNPNTSENITVIECCSADGWLMPPFIIFKGARPLADWLWESGVPEHTALEVSSNGWITDGLALKCWIVSIKEQYQGLIQQRVKKEYYYLMTMALI